MNQRRLKGPNILLYYTKIQFHPCIYKPVIPCWRPLNRTLLSPSWELLLRGWLAGQVQWLSRLVSWLVWQAALQAALTTTVAIRCASTTAQASFPVRGGICCHLVAVSGNGGDGLVALDCKYGNGGENKFNTFKFHTKLILWGNVWMWKGPIR
jgi:hypothetical protein